MPSRSDGPAWKALAAHARDIAGVPPAWLFDAEADRCARHARALDGLYVDLTRQHLAADTPDLLLDLARETGVEDRRRALFAGEPVNRTEDRPALHMALRAPDDADFRADGEPVMPAVAAERGRMLALADDLRAGRVTGADGQAVADVVSVGIGGSHHGPALAAEALGDGTEPRVRFVASADAADLLGALDACEPATTLVIVESKSFTTAETLLNAATARDWLVSALGAGAAARQMIAVTADRAAAQAAGYSPERIFAIWPWVGGRYSLWSAMGLPAAVAGGGEAFSDLLAGARAMDEHFRTAPLEDNLPVLLALADVWNFSFLGIRAHAVLAYDERLRRLPAHLQQLLMESTGKTAGEDGRDAGVPTGPVVFGMTGTEAQHTFMQAFHQGADPVAVDFVAAAEPGRDAEGHHAMLIANMIAQAEALMRGHPADGAPHKDCPGGRPSTTILVDRLDARRLGMLLALYEHRAFVQGVLWGIDPFDQWGVEAGKVLARGLLAGIAAGEVPDGHDAAAEALVRRYLARRAWTPT